jgi:hypothetical protein
MRIPPCISVAGALCVLIGCGDAPKPQAKTQPAEAVQDHTVTVHDQSAMLPAQGRKHSGIVADHVAGITKLPGGTVGDYESGGRKYQIFLVDAATNQQAAFLLLDAKAALKDPEYLASFGGYFGSDGTRPVFVFARLQYLVGIAGLPKDKADPIARTLGARLH